MVKLDNLFSLWDVPQAHRDDAKLSVQNCPLCGRMGQWRRGQEFDHEKICMRHSPAPTWCPGAIKDYREMVSQKLIGVDGSGI